MITDWTFWAVLIGAVVGHWLLPERVRAWFLALTSVGYLAFVEFHREADKIDIRLGFLFLLAFAGLFYSASQNFSVEPKPGKAARTGPPRVVVFALVVLVLGYLAYYKYYPPIERLIKPPTEQAPATAIVVPLGASYFTFKLIHYILESSRARTRPDGTTEPNIPRHGIDTFLAYIFFFPIFTAGPIERFDSFLKNRMPKLSLEEAVNGITRIIYGLIKKFVIVDIILSRSYQGTERPGLIDAIPLWSPPLRIDQLLPELPNLSPLFVWHYLINQFLRTYVDFSAYSDIAIGAALLFGVRIMENFNWPIFAKNIGEFWKRWHISLSGWCQQYVYLPLIGRTRNPYVAVYATQMAIGLWHGANLNFIAWGAYHGTLMVTFLTWGRIKRRYKWKIKGRFFEVAGAVLTFLCVSAGHAFVSTSDIGFRAGARLLARLVGIDIAPLVEP